MPQYCLITHTIHSVAIDGSDTDRDPDHHPVTGMVVFEPVLNKGDSVVVTTNDQSQTIVLAPIEARITNGEIYHRGEKGIKLFAGGPDTNPEKIRWKAKFLSLIAGGNTVSLKEILFEAVPGGKLNLADAQPVPGAPYPGYSMQAEEAILRIDTSKAMALTEISTERASALASVNSAVQARLDSMAPMVWVFHGTGAPTLAGFPGARVNDVIRRMADGQEWRVDA